MFNPRPTTCGQQRWRLGAAAPWLVVAIALSCVGAARAEDWPTHMHDVARSGTTSERLALPLSPHWVFTSKHAPEPAWPPPKSVEIEYVREVHKVDFDEAYQAVVAGGALYFGSSADNKVYCLDASTGEVRWSFFTGAPVRLAPTVWNGKVLVGSDDGFAYCLSADTGKLLWKFRAAPHDDELLGNGKMMSLWPVRTGILVDKGIAYFAAGLFPGEDVYLYAVRAEDGELVWKNDASAQATSGWRSFSPQGYLLASATTLFVPCGKVLPAAFDRSNGRMLYQRESVLWWHSAEGGTYALLADDHLYGGGQEVVAYDQKTGGVGFAWFPGRRLITKGDFAYLLTDNALFALDRKTSAQASWKRGQFNAQMRSRLDYEKAELQRSLKSLNVQIDAARKELEELEKQSKELKSPQAAEAIELRRTRDAVSQKIESLSSQPDAVTQRLAEIEEQFNNHEKLEEAYRKTVIWQTPCERPESMILAGEVLFAGAQDEALAFDAATGKELWRGKVDGKAKGLAVSGGRLFVSTDKGAIHCFGDGKRAAPVLVADPLEPDPYPEDKLTPIYKAAVERIIKETGVTKGYCLVLGSGQGRLAFEIARATDLVIYGIDEDAKDVRKAREALDAAGLYGTRVTVQKGSLSDLPYADYFANLIVSDEMLISGRRPGSADEMFRVLKPCGGVAYIGQPKETMKLWRRLNAKKLRQWLKEAEVADAQLTEGDGVWAKIERGPLPGAGKWTHQYANPANTTCSDDELVRLPLGVLWFGRPGPAKMVQRHYAVAAPLSVNGRMFIQGENVVMAYDAYNGVQLWEREIEGAMRENMRGDCSNLAADEDSLFVAVADKCLRLDAATGETRQTYSLPPFPDAAPQSWGYVAVVGDVLFGSTTQEGSTCDLVFALDVDSGRLRWDHRGKTISHNTIAIGDGRVFLAESDVTAEQRQEALKQKLVRLPAPEEPEAAEAQEELDSADVRLVCALDADSGSVVWQTPVDLTDCGDWLLHAIYQNDILLFVGSFPNGHYWRQFHAGALAHRRAVALSADDGLVLWNRALGYRTRPIVNGNTIYADPWAFDLWTGEQVMRTHPVTGEKGPWEFGRGHHCGAVSGSPNCLFFRSLTTAFYDLIRDSGVLHFGGHRPGCYINTIAANGLVLQPEASSGCVCPFSIHATVVFKPRRTDRAWGTFCSYTSDHKEAGFIQDWLICGPFPNYLEGDQTDYENHRKLCWGYAHDFLEEHGGEAFVIPHEGMECKHAAALKWRNKQMEAVYGGKTPVWQKYESPEYLVDFESLFPGADDSVAYAYCEIDSAQDRETVLGVGSDDGIKIWLNHEVVHDHHIGRGARVDEDQVPVRLKKGKNKLLVKVDESAGAWGFYLRELPLMRVRHLALNFGAPGDRRDRSGTLWLGYPRPSLPLALEFNMRTSILPGLGYYQLNPEGVRIEGTDKPWLFSFGCCGLTRCVVPVIGQGQEPGLYTVRLGFAELGDAGKGQRVFDIKLQGRQLAMAVDIRKEAGGPNRAMVREFKGIRVRRDLTIELVPKVQNPTQGQAPLISTLELIRE